MHINSIGTAALDEPASGKTAPPSAARSQGRAEFSAGPIDTATLSGASLEKTSLASQALASSDERTARVRSLRHTIADGSYTLDSNLTADAMLGSI